MAAGFDRAVELIYTCGGRVVVTGMGKSGIIARKIAATLSSTGTPALFMHPVDAVHGDLGMVVRGDVVLALSASGETEEILRLLATIKRLQVPLISMTGDAVFDEHRAAGESPAPHRLIKDLHAGGGGGCCARLFRRQGSLLTGTGADSFDHGHAGAGRCVGRGALRKARIQGRRLCQSASRRKTGQAAGARRVADARRRAVPRVTPKTKMPDVIYEMSRKKLGVTAVVDGEKLVGVISDGDLRRLLEKRGKDVLDLTRGRVHDGESQNDCARTNSPRPRWPSWKKRRSRHWWWLMAGHAQGIVHLHDLWGTEMV